MKVDRGILTKGVTISVTALLLGGAFVAFFGQAAGAVSVGVDSDSTVTQGNDLTVTVSVDLPSDERIPVEHVALKIQDASTKELLEDIRWEPKCDDGGFQFLDGYQKGATVEACKAFEGDNGPYSYTDEVFANGYLKGTDEGYGYNSAGGGYGYFEESNTGTFTGSGNGYGDGYGGDGSNNATLIWELSVPTGDLPTTDVELVSVIETGTTALGDFQSDQNEGVVTIESSTGGGGGGGGGAGDAGKDTAEKAASQCRPSCDLGDLAQDAQVTINADADHEVLHKITFDTTERITDAKVELDTPECDSPPSGVPSPPPTFPCRKLQRIDFKNGSADAGDKVESLEIQWKLRDAWRLGEDPPRDFPFPNDTISLGHYTDGEWTPTDTDPMDTPADRDASIWDFYLSMPDHLSTFAAGAHDETGPTFTNARPDPATDDKQPTIGVDYSDDGVGVNTDNVTITFDGQDVTDDATVTDSGVTYQPPSELDLGSYDVEVTAEDLLGNEAIRSWTFEVVPPDDKSPRVTSFSPENGATVGPDVSIEASYEDRGSPPSGIHVNAIVLTVDGDDVSGDAEITASSLTYTPEDGFQQGTHDVTLELADRVGNEETTSWSFDVQVEAPDEGLPWGWIIGIGLVVLVALAAAGAYYGGYLDEYTQ